MTNITNAKKYENIKVAISIGETFFSLTLLVFFIWSGLSTELRNLSLELSDNNYVSLLAFMAIFGTAMSLINFPLTFISEYWLEHRYHLSNQSLAAWLWEEAKGVMIGTVLVVPLLLIFYYFLRNYPQSWWFLLAIVLFFFSVILGRIAPQVIFPLFYKFESLDDEDISRRFTNLAGKGGFNLQGVYRFNLSKTTKKANAALTGIGKSKRIILGDTLLDNLSADELETVFGHEVGHHKHKHLFAGVVTATIFSFASFYIAHIVYGFALAQTNFSGIADLAALPLLFIILSIIGFIFMPLSNALGRRHEFQADHYALLNSTKPECFISSMKKLSKLNLTDISPHPVVEMIFHSHPSIEKRIEKAQQIIDEQ